MTKEHRTERVRQARAGACAVRRYDLRYARTRPSIVHQRRVRLPRSKLCSNATGTVPFSLYGSAFVTSIDARPAFKMNVSQISLPPQPDLHRISKEALEKDADVCIASSRFDISYTRSPVQFLALKLLNKRSRLRLSPEPIHLGPFPSKGRLFVISNACRWFSAAISNADGTYC